MTGQTPEETPEQPLEPVPGYDEPGPGVPPDQELPEAPAEEPTPEDES